MPKCPKCNKEVYFAERKTSLGKDWHAACLRCTECNKVLQPGSHAERDGKPYCNVPCYGKLFGPSGYGRGGTESHRYDKPRASIVTADLSAPAAPAAAPAPAPAAPAPAPAAAAPEESEAPAAAEAADE